MIAPPGDTFMMTFEFEAFEGHIVAHIDGNDCLVDTGSPLTFGEGRSMPSFGKTEIGAGLPGLDAHEVGRLLGRPLDILLGTDLLGNQPFLVDWEARTITFDPETRPAGSEIPLDNIMGCPLVSARIGGQALKLAVDTGARVTFLNPSLVAGERPVGHYDDFYITCGPFTCDSFEKTVDVGDVSLDLVVGGLPPDLETGLGFIGLDGILGNDIFDHYPKVLYDLRENMLTLYR